LHPLPPILVRPVCRLKTAKGPTAGLRWGLVLWGDRDAWRYSANPPPRSSRGIALPLFPMTTSVGRRGFGHIGLADVALAALPLETVEGLADP
jgi:hypothetical protein